MSKYCERLFRLRNADMSYSHLHFMALLLRVAPYTGSKHTLCLKRYKFNLCKFSFSFSCEEIFFVCSGVSVLEKGYQGHCDANWQTQVEEGLLDMKVLAINLGA